MIAISPSKRPSPARLSKQTSKIDRLAGRSAHYAIGDRPANLDSDPEDAPRCRKIDLPVIDDRVRCQHGECRRERPSELLPNCLVAACRAGMLCAVEIHDRGRHRGRNRGASFDMTPTQPVFTQVELAAPSRVCGFDALFFEKTERRQRLDGLANSSLRYRPLVHGPQRSGVSFRDLARVVGPGERSAVRASTSPITSCPTLACATSLVIKSSNCSCTPALRF